MVERLNKRDISVIILLLIIFTIIDIFLYLSVHKKQKIGNISNNEYNSYDSVYITADKQASIYLSNYYNLIRLDTAKAFEKYEKHSLKNLKTLDQFKSYLNNMNISSSKITQLNYHKGRKYSYYSIIDANGNRVTFKAKGVMDYTVDFR